MRRKAFIRKWRLKHRAVADSLEEAGGRFSPSHDCRRANGGARVLPMQSNDCTRSSSKRHSFDAPLDLYGRFFT